MLIVPLLIACGEEEKILETEGYTSDGGYYVRYDTNPSPIPVNAPFVLGIDVFTDESKSIRSLDITVDSDAEMPEHGHGMNLLPPTEEVEDGRFEADGFLFHMTGDWEIIIYVNGLDGSESIRFPVTLRAAP